MKYKISFVPDIPVTNCKFETVNGLRWASTKPGENFTHPCPSLSSGCHLLMCDCLYCYHYHHRHRDLMTNYHDFVINECL